MHLKKIISVIVILLFMSSCVSKKKFVEMETNFENAKSELQQSKIENEKLEAKLNEIDLRAARYKNKIAALNDDKKGMLVNDGEIVLSERNKEVMRKTLAKVPQSSLSGATTLKDSLNIAIAYNISKNLGSDTDDLKLSIGETYVKINIDDNLLFKDSSFSVGNSADDILQKIADIAKSEPALEIMVEGHTDDRTIKKESYIIDNWDLSSRRSAAIVRRLQDKFKVPSEQLILAARSSFDPIVPNNSKENMAKNRRTQIVIMPNLDKFFALLGEE